MKKHFPWNARQTGVMILAVLLCAGCADRPELEQTAIAPAGPTPALLPIDALIAETGADVTRGDPGAELSARAARLKARARALQGATQSAGT